jgi:hypothetical protein
MGVGDQCHAPAALPPGMTQYPLYRRLGRPQGRSGRVLKISPTPGFDPRTVQLVASRYTDYAIPAHDLPADRIILNRILEKVSSNVWTGFTWFTTRCSGGVLLWIW